MRKAIFGTYLTSTAATAAATNKQYVELAHADRHSVGARCLNHGYAGDSVGGNDDDALEACAPAVVATTCTSPSTIVCCCATFDCASCVERVYNCVSV